MQDKRTGALQSKDAQNQERTVIPAEVLRDLSPEAAQRLQRLVDSSERLQRLAYGEDDEPRRLK